MGGMICRELLEEKRKEVTPLLFHYFLVTWKADLTKTSNCCGFPKVFSPTCKTPSPIHNPKCSIWTQGNEEWKEHHQYWTLLLVDMNSLLWAPWCTRATCQDTTQRSAICWSIKMLMPLHVDEKLRAWCKLGPKSVTAGREKKQGVESWVLQSPLHSEYSTLITNAGIYLKQRLKRQKWPLNVNIPLFLTSCPTKHQIILRWTRMILRSKIDLLRPSYTFLV